MVDLGVVLVRQGIAQSGGLDHFIDLRIGRIAALRRRAVVSHAALDVLAHQLVSLMSQHPGMTVERGLLQACQLHWLALARQQQGANVDAGRFRRWLGRADARRVEGGALAGDEVAPGLPAHVVVLDHRQLFGHVEGQVVVDARAPAEVFPRFGENLHVVATGNKSVFFDAGFYPCGEVPLDLHEGMQGTCIAQPDGGIGKGAREDGNESGCARDEISHEWPPSASVCKNRRTRDQSGAAARTGWSTGKHLREPAEPRLPHPSRQKLEAEMMKPQILRGKLRLMSQCLHERPISATPFFDVDLPEV